MGRQASLLEAQGTDGGEPARDTRGVDLAPLPAPEAVEQRRRAGVRPNHARVDGSELERRVRHRPVEPAHHVHVREEAGERAQVVLVDVVRQVAEPLVARQRGDGAHQNLVRQACERGVGSVDEDDVGRGRIDVRGANCDLVAVEVRIHAATLLWVDDKDLSALIGEKQSRESTREEVGLLEHADALEREARLGHRGRQRAAGDERKARLG
mmetsp:Transcript_26468/g.76959  ORF Transcript_26468/g.76959 Transcript_26468/m.76959 type:complete len:211 (+) Transcript_26468:2076-2708(+)